MSKTITFNAAIGPNATNASIFAGNLFEFMAGPSAIKLWINSTAVGLNVSVLVGNETFVQDQEILRIAAANGPSEQDDAFVVAAGLQGERLVVSLRNTTAAAITGRVRAEITPVV